VGYQEWFAHFEGKLTKEATLAEIQKNSRRYAKRQMTWFQKKKSKIVEIGTIDLSQIIHLLQLK